METLLQPKSRKIYTVSEVTKDIRGLLEDSFASIWLTAEVSNFRAPSSGHFYFTLKDENSQIPAVMFRGSNHLLKFQLEDGLELVAHGRISVYEPRGQYQIIVDYAEPKGLGALQLAFEQLKRKLEAEGIFNKEYKKPIPFLPKKVGIITSSKGAALHDMITILTRRFSNIEILIHPVLVQGEGAKEQIAQAIGTMNKQTDLDVLIVGRGGGALEDLWAFNEEVVVRAIFSSRIPIISAVGHETDFTLSDLVADLRAPTPSAAAELAVPDRESLIIILSQHRSGLIFAIRQILKNYRDQLFFHVKSLKDPRRILEDLKLKIDDRAQKLILIQKQILLQIKIRLDGIHKHLESVSPLAILKRGYSIVFKSDKLKPVRSMNDVKNGDLLEIQLYEGKIKVRVT